LKDFYKSNKKSYFIRISNLPNHYEKNNIIDIFKSYSLDEKNISIAHDIFKIKTREACIKINNKNDFNEIVSNGNL